LLVEEHWQIAGVYGGRGCHFAVASYYIDFSGVSDGEIKRLVEKSESLNRAAG